MPLNLLSKETNQKRLIDLAVLAGKKRLSPRTHFVHLFPTDDSADTIPIYENFCFALALFRTRTAESITLGKSIVERLLPFQCEDGNFPVFLHEYPKAHHFHLSLKIAPILIYLLRFFSNILGSLQPKIEQALALALKERPEKLLWLNRYFACMGLSLLPIDPSEFDATEWTEHLITLQLAGEKEIQLPFDPDLNLLRVPSMIQEGFEPKPTPIEWLLAEGDYRARHLDDHPDQLLAAPLFPIEYTQIKNQNPFPLYWMGQVLHSLEPDAKNLQKKGEASLIYELEEAPEMGRNDLFEVLLYLNISDETEIFVNGQKATTFWLGDQVTLKTGETTIGLTFLLSQGFGDFCGGISRANRPSQKRKGYEAYDWQIGLRTLRRSDKAQITVKVSR